MNDRFIKLMQHYNLSPSLFADEIGVNRPAISHIISGRNKPGVDLIQKVLKRFPEVSTDWLLMGTGSMLPSKSTNAQEAKASEKLSPTVERKDLFTYTEKEENTNSKTTGTHEKSSVVLSDQPANAQIKRITVYFNDGSFKDFVGDD